MPNIADAKKALAALEGGADLVAAIDAELADVRKESAGYRTKLRNAENRNKTLATHLGIDPEVDDLDGALAGMSKPGKGSEYTALQSQLATLQKTVEASEKAAKDEKALRVQSEVRSAVKDALIAKKAISPDDLTDLLAGKVRIEGETRSIVAEDGRVLSIADGVDAFLKTRPQFVGMQQKPGPGGSGNSGVKPETNLDPVSKLEQAFAGQE